MSLQFHHLDPTCSRHVSGYPSGLPDKVSERELTDFLVQNAVLKVGDDYESFDQSADPPVLTFRAKPYAERAIKNCNGKDFKSGVVVKVERKNKGKKKQQDVASGKSLVNGERKVDVVSTTA